jgi:integrase/recombinase XerD
MYRLVLWSGSNVARLDQLIDDFLASARARGLSPKTIREYRFPLNEVLLPYCRKHGLTEPEQLTRSALDRLSAQLLDEGGKSGRPLSRHTIASYLRSVNVFLSWAQSEGEAVAARAKAPKSSKRLIDVLSREEITAMEDTATAERDKLIVRVLADTGIRVGELVNLTVNDLIERDRTHYLRVGGKTGERMVPIPRLYRRLLRYAQRGRPRDVPSDRMFISLRRRPGGDYGPLTASGVEQVIQDLGASAGITKRVYPHLLRHSYATWALTRGMNPIMLANILGHTSLAMIQNVYSHLTPTDAYEAMVRAQAEDERFVPAASIPKR